MDSSISNSEPLPQLPFRHRNDNVLHLPGTFKHVLRPFAVHFISFHFYRAAIGHFNLEARFATEMVGYGYLTTGES